MAEYVVATTKGTNVGSLTDQLKQPTSLLNVPDREITVTDNRDLNDRLVVVDLTEEEASELNQNADVLSVHPKPLPQFNELHGEVNGDYNRSSTNPNTALNWGLIRHTNGFLEGATAQPYNADYKYHLDGSGVDIVIQDDGVNVDHPEFEDVNGVTRVKQIDWYAETGLTGTMPINFYSDNSSAGVGTGGSHGSHVAGIAAGKTYGWAKGADIYSMRIFGGSTYEVSIDDAFDLIRIWHENKPIDPITGTKRPTIVNQSWGSRWFYSNSNTHNNPIIRDIFYKGVLQQQPSSPPTSTNPRSVQYGMTNDTHGIRVPSYDVLQEQLSDAGVICCKSSGNYYHAIGVEPDPLQSPPAATIYDSYYTSDTAMGGIFPAGSPVHYQRGASPMSSDSIVVGNIDAASNAATQDQTARSSERGPRVDFWAAGTNIASSTSENPPWVYGEYPPNPSYKMTTISGTSMASPQVAGMCCLLLQLYPSYTTEQVKAYFNENVTHPNNLQPTIFDTGLDDDYTNLNTNYSSYGSSNKVIFWPNAPADGTKKIFETEGSMVFSGAFLKIN